MLKKEDELFNRRNDGEVYPVDTTDTLLMKWCSRKNEKLRKAKRIVEESQSIYWTSSIWLDMFNRYKCNHKDEILKQWCDEKNAMNIRQEELTAAIKRGWNLGVAEMDEKEFDATYEEQLLKLVEEESKRRSDAVLASWVDCT